MKILCLILLFASSLFAQTVENLLLTTYSGDGRTPDTAFRPTIALRLSIKFEDITSVEEPDSVGLVLIRAEYDAALAAAIASDTTCFVISRTPANNNRGQFVSFLARKKNGKRLSDEIAKRPNVDFRDIILELNRMDKKKPRVRAK